MAKKVLATDIEQETARGTAPIQMLAQKIAEGSQVSGKTTFVPLVNSSGDRFIEEMRVNTFGEGVNHILAHLKTLPSGIIVQLCKENGVSIGAAASQP